MAAGVTVVYPYVVRAKEIQHSFAVHRKVKSIVPGWSTYLYLSEEPSHEPRAGEVRVRVVGTLEPAVLQRLVRARELLRGRERRYGKALDAGLDTTRAHMHVIEAKYLVTVLERPPTESLRVQGHEWTAPFGAALRLVSPAPGHIAGHIANARLIDPLSNSSQL